MIDGTGDVYWGSSSLQTHQGLCYVTALLTSHKRDDPASHLLPSEVLPRIVLIWSLSPRIKPVRSPRPAGNEEISLVSQADDQSTWMAKTYVCATATQTYPSQLTPVHRDQDENIDTGSSQGDK